MKQKLKSVIQKRLVKKAGYWGSVITLGIVLGISLQFVRAWVEPTGTAPAGNVGAPINTGNNTQVKQGALAVRGVMVNNSLALFSWGAYGPDNGVCIGDCQYKLWSLAGSLYLNSSVGHTYIQPNGGNVGIGTTSPNGAKGLNGNLDVNDMYIRSTGKWASEGGGINFINQTQFVNVVTSRDWTTFDASPYIPAGAKGVIVLTEGRLNGPDNTAYSRVFIRRNASSSPYIALQGWSAGSEDGSGSSQQGFYPIDNNRTFQYKIGDQAGFSFGVNMYLVGYIM